MNVGASNDNAGWIDFTAWDAANGSNVQTGQTCNPTYNAPADNRQRILCDNIKNAGVTIYTIQVNVSNDPTSSVLQAAHLELSSLFPPAARTAHDRRDVPDCRRLEGFR